MIGYLNGTSVRRVNFVATVVVGGVGYEVTCYEEFENNGASVHEGNVCKLWVHEHAPQDAPHELYGFQTSEKRDKFRRLLEIKGVGPKVAARVVASGLAPNVAELCKIRGVGATLAQRIFDEIA